ncbi:TonB-dependent receptor [Alteromonas sp. BL110]|uniref:TonB-dependent receptor n=1 Tax=Alteromonas sp. BL110 TaxID=1714845 RepID=UPI000E4E224F|nr:TonB-dependent receptor [Alteromonas sp. BL110]AXT40558.1 TonB-dependent receptor [Alteromonas sp. BL110]RKM79794.1 TonB-dependent receptor [Alteromonas sp. BL110]
MNHTSYKKSKVANAILLSLLSATSTVTATSALAQDKDVETPVDQQAESAEENLDVITVYGRHNRLILESGTATKSNMSLMETPAAIVVVDGTLLREQGVDTLQESIRNISGLSQDGNNYGVGDNLAIRGLGVNYTFDGIYAGADLGNSYNPTRSMTNIESIEVLKGPATGLYGMGEAGGIINLIEKKPQFQEAYEIKASVGSWDSYSIMADATGAINKDLAYRVVANREQSDGYRGLSDERSELYTSLKYVASSDNQFLLSAAYIDDAVQIDSVGHPVRLIDLTMFDTDAGSLTGADLVNDTAESGGLQLTDAQRDELAASLVSTDGVQPFDLGDTSLISPISRPNEGEEFRVKLRQDLAINDDWSLTQQLQYRTYETSYIRQTSAYNYVYVDRNGTTNLEPRAPLVIDDVLYPYAARRQEYRKVEAQESVWQYFIDLTNTWSLGDIRGEHLFSANYENMDVEYAQWSIWDADDTRSDAVPYILDIRKPNWPTGTFEDYNPALRSKYDKEVSSWGVSFQEVLYLNDNFTARIGGAYGGVKQTYQNQFSDGNPEYDANDDGFTYNLGLTYMYSDSLSTFINHSKGRTAYSVLGSLSEEDNRPDSESESWDLGVRFTALNEQVIGSVVVFDTARTNLQYTNPLYEDNIEDPSYNVDVPEFYYDEQDRTTGVEVDINFDINEQWSLNANGTYQEPRTEPGAFASSTDEEQTKGIAEKFASTWLTYSHSFEALPAPVKFSVGVTYEDERTISASAFGVDYAFVDSYTVWDAAVSYVSDDWDVQLNIRNLDNTDYYSSAMYLGGLPGEERNAKLSVAYRF